MVGMQVMKVVTVEVDALALFDAIANYFGDADEDWAAGLARLVGHVPAVRRMLARPRGFDEWSVNHYEMMHLVLEDCRHGITVVVSPAPPY